MQFERLTEFKCQLLHIVHINCLLCNLFILNFKEFSGGFAFWSIKVKEHIFMLSLEEQNVKINLSHMDTWLVPVDGTHKSSLLGITQLSEPAWVIEA